MSRLPSYEQQIALTHAPLIVAVATAALSGQRPPELEQALDQSAANGWTDLVAALRRVLAGERDEAVLAGLDEEDMAIVRAVLRGIQDPDTLPDPEARPDPGLAAPGLASLVHGAARGDAQALQMLAGIAEQMTAAGGDMARLGGIMKRLVDGERDAECLAKGMSAQGESLLLSILEELGRLEAH